MKRLRIDAREAIGLMCTGAAFHTDQIYSAYKRLHPLTGLPAVGLLIKRYYSAVIARNEAISPDRPEIASHALSAQRGRAWRKALAMTQVEQLQKAAMKKAMVTTCDDAILS